MYSPLRRLPELRLLVVMSLFDDRNLNRCLVGQLHHFGVAEEFARGEAVRAEVMNGVFPFRKEEHQEITIAHRGARPTG